MYRKYHTMESIAISVSQYESYHEQVHCYCMPQAREDNDSNV